MMMMMMRCWDDNDNRYTQVLRIDSPVLRIVSGFLSYLPWSSCADMWIFYYIGMWREDECVCVCVFQIECSPSLAVCCSSSSFRRISCRNIKHFIHFWQWSSRNKILVDILPFCSTAVCGRSELLGPRSSDVAFFVYIIAQVCINLYI